MHSHRESPTSLSSPSQPPSSSSSSSSSMLLLLLLLTILFHSPSPSWKFPPQQPSFLDFAWQRSTSFEPIFVSFSLSAHHKWPPNEFQPMKRKMHRRNQGIPFPLLPFERGKKKYGGDFLVFVVSGGVRRQFFRGFGEIPVRRSLPFTMGGGSFFFFFRGSPLGVPMRLLCFQGNWPMKRARERFYFILSFLFLLCSFLFICKCSFAQQLESFVYLALPSVYQGFSGGSLFSVKNRNLIAVTLVKEKNRIHLHPFVKVEDR